MEGLIEFIKLQIEHCGDSELMENERWAFELVLKEAIKVKSCGYTLLTNDSELLLCKHIMTRNPKEHQENKCRLCGKPYKKKL